MSDDNDNNKVSPIYMVTVSAPTNIAVIKYWGKSNEQYNTPINSSISITLDQNDLRAVTTVAASYTFINDRLWLNGIEDINVNTNKRFRSCIDGMKQLASDRIIKTDGDNDIIIKKDDWKQMKIHVSSYNTFPTAAGLASSAAGYAALVSGLQHLMNCLDTYPGEITTIARQGSGSACRSLYGGFVKWNMGSANNNWKDSIAIQITNEYHWPEIRSIIIVVSDIQKDTGSTIGMMNSVNTSSLLQYRATHIVPQRIIDMEHAWCNHNFHNFAKLTIKDSNQFHSTCLDTYPPIFYMNDISRMIIQLITLYNDYYNNKNLRVAYTFDAGPNPVLYLLDKDLLEVSALILYYFPIPTTSNDSNMNILDYMIHTKDIKLIEQIQSYTLSPDLISYCNQKCPKLVLNTKTNNDMIQKIYITESGCGPKVLSNNESNLDPTTGLNIYHPKRKL